MFGLSAQLIETSNDSKKAQASAQRAEASAHETERLLSSIKHVKVKMSFSVPCDDKSFSQLCRSALDRPWLLSDPQESSFNTRLWNTVPSAKSATGVDMAATVSVVKNPEKATQIAVSGAAGPDPDLGFLVVANSLSKENRLGFEKMSSAGGKKIVVLTAFGDEASASGEIVSALDIPGCFVFITYKLSIPGYPQVDFKPVLVELILDNDQIISTSDLAFTKVKDGGGAVGTFPERKTN
jgi:hypothetical protein